MTRFLFLFVVTNEVLLLTSLALSVAAPDRRVWPPPGRRSWQFWFTWIPTWLALGGGVLLGVFDWDSFIFPDSVRYPIGIVLTAGGLSFGYWGLRTLGAHASLGLGGAFVLAGPYRWSRNPQYVGDIVALIGFGILCNSLSALVAALLGACWFGFAPLAEEPWLRQRFGDAYDQYRRSVPRFVGIRRSSEADAV